jgi:hypothetical protein
MTRAESVYLEAVFLFCSLVTLETAHGLKALVRQDIIGRKG